VHAKSLPDAKRIAEQEFGDGSLQQCGEEVETVIAFRLRTRVGSWSTFERRFKPIDREEGCPWWEREDLPWDVDYRHVWTILDCEGRLYVSPGFRFVNRLGYVRCAVAWTDEDRHQPDYRYD
jgi:hypothetical protein